MARGRFRAHSSVGPSFRAPSLARAQLQGASLQLAQLQGAVRDLAVYGDRILILAGPAMGEGGPFSIYSWDGSGANVELLKDLPSYGSELKPEALLPLDQDATSLRVLLLLDGEKEGGPRTERIKIPR